MFTLHAFDAERGVRLHARADDGRDALETFTNVMHTCCDALGARAMRHALEVARGASYNHPGLSHGAYLAHPLRLARWTLAIDNPPDLQMTTIALLHNIYEVSAMRADDVTRAVGGSVADAITVLTVDRSQQDNVAYREQYYRQLHAAGRRVCVIKVLDKLDNLFLLCLNDDDAVRAAYLQEVRDFIVPLAAMHIPECVPHLEALVQRCVRDGHVAVSDISAFAIGPL